MSQASVYIDLDGREICLRHLDVDERRLLGRIRRRAQAHPDWEAFDNFWTNAVPAFYEARGLTRKAVPQTIPWQIAQDLSGRIAVAAGMARLGDYRDDLEELIREKYATQRAFCRATGLAEDMLSHFLKGRKDLSLKSLTEALERIGYALHIRPIPNIERAGPSAAAPVAAKKRTG